jgi:hypothetical protein
MLNLVSQLWRANPSNNLVKTALTVAMVGESWITFPHRL